MKVEVNIHEAKTHLSRLLARVEAGDEVVISRAGKPIAKLLAFAPLEGKRQPGRDAGRVRIAPDFDGPLPEDMVSRFEGE